MTSDQRSSRLILASASPRRKSLMEKAGYQFDVAVSDIDESRIRSDLLTCVQYAEKLAVAKAENVAQKYPADIVIGADTLVECRGQIIGKPSDADDARRIVTMLFSQPHQVITALAVIRLADNTRLVESDKTSIFPKQMTAEEIDTHIASGTWQDKAGAYAIQENDRFIQRIAGSRTNVMGMPMELLEKLLGRVRT